VGCVSADARRTLPQIRSRETLGLDALRQTRHRSRPPVRSRARCTRTVRSGAWGGTVRSRFSNAQGQLSLSTSRRTTAVTSAVYLAGGGLRGSPFGAHDNTTTNPAQRAATTRATVARRPAAARGRRACYARTVALARAVARAVRRIPSAPAASSGGVGLRLTRTH
jgi:hypothetical protein